MPKYRNRGMTCPASGSYVGRDPSGRGRCPLCGDDWHCVSKSGRLHAHVFAPKLTWRDVEWFIAKWPEEKKVALLKMWPPDKL